MQVRGSRRPLTAVNSPGGTGAHPGDSRPEVHRGEGLDLTPRTAEALADLVALDAELRGDLCGAAATLLGRGGVDRVVCVRPRHDDESDPEHFGVVWLVVEERSRLGSVRWMTW